MVRRALLSLFPAILATLAFLHGTPGTRASEPYTHEADPHAAGVLSAAAVRGNLTDDVPDLAVSQGADADDNSSALTTPGAVAVVWPDSAFERRILEAGDRAGPNYWPCVAVPRAPPAV